MDSLRASSRRRMATVITGLAILVIYSYPYFATTRTLASRQVPYGFAADLSLYLNLSQLGSSGDQPPVNPYYGTPMESGVFGYLTFDLGFRLFGWLANVAGHNLWYAVLLWNWLWWVAICVGGLWLFRLILPENTGPVLWLGMSLLFFLNFGDMRALLGAWLHLPSMAGFEAVNLPYIRAFFPQIPAALLLFYLSFQIRALRFSRWYDWMAMCALQGVAFAMFPYATLIMAGSTFVIAWACVGSLLPKSRLRAVIPYGLVCAAVDLTFLMYRLAPAQHDAKVAFVRLRPLHVVDLTGGALILLLLLSLLIGMLPPAGCREGKWTLAGLGLSNALLMLGDAVFAPSLLMSAHGGYFVRCTAALQVTYLVAGRFARFEPAHRWVRPACLTAMFLVTLNGAMLAQAGYRAFLSQNSEVSKFAETLRSLKVDDNDLVIARADTVDDLCSWVPLLNRGRVLFCRSAQYELSDSERRGMHRLRQAFYLYFTGKDSGWVDQVVRDQAALTAQDRLAFAGEISTSDKETLETGRRGIAAELIPQLAEVEERPAEARDFFRPYLRVVVIDKASRPTFVKERLTSYLAIDSEQAAGDFVVLRCRPNQQPEAGALR